MKNEKVFLFFLLFLLLVLFSKPVLAESNHVLPYPSSMPGGLTYKFHLVFEEISKYWYFGNFGQVNYNLKMTDKYLVEAKTLFEYRQYLLAHKALKKSDFYFAKIMPYLIRANKEKKNIILKRTVFKDVSEKHIEVLEKLRTLNPETFFWQPEKAMPTTLYLKKAIENSIKIRKTGL